jgi:two-component system, LytTR family, sensor kinase
VAESQRRVSIPLIVGVASALGLFSTFEAYNYVTIFTSEHPSFGTLLALNVTYWWSWAVLVPGIIWLARRYRFGRQTWRRSMGVHIGGVVVFTAAHTVLTVTCRVLILTAAGRPTNWLPELQRLFLMNFDWEMMTYWAVVGLSHALDFHRESQDQAVTAAHLETRLAEAQLQALQRQLHPHFLFNTLHAISALMHRDTEAADAMLARLSELLRLTLDRITVQQVALRDEIEFIDKYLEIERTRFGDRLHVRTDIDPETLDAAVPTLMLQPIVENAIRHGIARRVGGGHLQIRARREADRLLLVVQDDGPGLPQARRDALNTGVGLTNTRSRLEYLYRNDYRFEFAESPGGGLTVTIALPFLPAVENPPTMEGVA